MKKHGSGTRGWRLGNLIRVSLLLAGGFLGLTEDMFAGEGARDARITVRVYDYAQVPPSELAKAQSKTTIILRKAGIQTVWLECHRPGAGFHIAPGCKQPLGPTDLVMTVVPGAMAARLSFRDAELGFAPLPAETEGGFYAQRFYLSYDRVKGLAERGTASRSQVLGHGAAHEIGHLLLPSLGHPRTRIMRADWGRKDLQRISMQGLYFTSQQGGALRAAVRARIRAEETAETASLRSP